jgi:outer membrane protein assembly factor BamE (lipoprotein component of BamABCDE complex)
MKKRTLFPVLVSLLVSSMALSACEPVTAVRGNFLDEYQMKSVQAGVDTREDVVRKIGSPTTVAPFDPNVWYYLGQKTEKNSILDPKITDERIVVVTFAGDGVVDSVKERKDGREDVPLVQDTTPTSGNEYTFLQQMLGNLGKFNKQGKENAATTASGANGGYSR